jgi:hypothetical protein
MDRVGDPESAVGCVLDQSGALQSRQIVMAAAVTPPKGATAN